MESIICWVNLKQSAVVPKEPSLLYLPALPAIWANSEIVKGRVFLPSNLFSFEKEYYDDVWKNGSTLRYKLCKPKSAKKQFKIFKSFIKNKIKSWNVINHDNNYLIFLRSYLNDKR